MKSKKYFYQLKLSVIIRLLQYSFKPISLTFQLVNILIINGSGIGPQLNYTLTPFIDSRRPHNFTYGITRICSVMIA